MNKSKKKEILSCPFCLHEDCYIMTEEGEFVVRYYVDCFFCDARGPVAPTEEEAIKQWNKRA